MLDPRLRQLHDEPRSGGNQSAHQRMINRRFNDRASCFAQRRLYCEGNAKKGGEDFLRLLLETANIRVASWSAMSLPASSNPNRADKSSVSRSLPDDEAAV